MVVVVVEVDEDDGITVVVVISMGVGRDSFRMVAAERVMEAERDFTCTKFTICPCVPVAAVCGR